MGEKKIARDGPTLWNDIGRSIDNVMTPIFGSKSPGDNFLLLKVFKTVPPHKEKHLKVATGTSGVTMKTKNGRGLGLWSFGSMVLFVCDKFLSE